MKYTASELVHFVVFLIVLFVVLLELAYIFAG